MKKPLKVAVSGAAGNIAYALLFRIAAGEMFGPDQPIELQLLEVPADDKRLDGLVMELEDCASPLLRRVRYDFDAREAFADADWALLIGAKPRGPGMERKDLLATNGAIFQEQGRALNECASRDARVVVVGNPANTNALIAAHHAPNLAPAQFSAMLRLDHNRAVSLLRRKTGGAEVRKMAVWGNHSTTQFPDLSHCEVDGKPALERVERRWFEDDFVPAVQQRGARVIERRGASSAASAAAALIGHVRDWARGDAPGGDWTSMGVVSQGDYGVSPGLVFSYPVVVGGGRWEVAGGLELDEYQRGRLQATEKELLEERDAIRDLLS